MSLWHYLVLFLIIGLVALGNLGREANKQTNTALEEIRNEQAKYNTKVKVGN